jgi:hypothetical protein
MKKTGLKYLMGCGFLLLILTVLSAQTKPESLLGESPFFATPIVHALKEAYPGIITQAVFNDNDWTLTVRGQQFQWAQGRLLPSDLTNWKEDYGAYPFYNYSPDYNPPLRSFTKKQEEEMDKLIEQLESAPINRHPGFLKALYRIDNEESVWNIMKTTFFLGHKVMIHRDLLEDLARVEERIQSAVIQDSLLREYVDSIGSLAGFNWRAIEGTETLSNHSFGIAIDIIPKDYKGKEVYWRWSLPFFPKWYSLPWEKRHMPPQAFVEAFEEEGFIWGGKWLFYDSIHFEYRPEILILNGIR